MEGLKQAWATSLAVLCGGALGAVCRVAGNTAIMRYFDGGFPYGILCINVLGGLLMGVLSGVLCRCTASHPVVSRLLGTGFLGGLTTFSSVSVNTLTLYQHGQIGEAYLNLFLNAVLCVCAAGVGFALVNTHRQ